MKNTLSSLIRSFVEILAIDKEKDVIYILVNKALELLDPKKEKLRNINKTVNFSQIPYNNINRSLGHVQNLQRPLETRIKLLNTAPNKELLTSYKEIEVLYNETLKDLSDYFNSSKKLQQDEKEKLLNTATENLLKIKEIITDTFPSWVNLAPQRGY